jgi:hypothetical protein
MGTERSRSVWTRAIRPVVACALVALGLTAAWFAPDAACYVEGRFDAGKAVASGAAELRSIGLIRPARGRFDPDTGLFVRSLGCISTGWKRGYESGWNAAVRAAAANGETDSVSLRRKVRTEARVAEEFAAAVKFVLPSDTTPVRAPSGRFEVRSDETNLMVRAAGADDWQWSGLSVTNATVVFVDEGTTLIVREGDGASAQFTTVDLPSARALQEWP